MYPLEIDGTTYLYDGIEIELDSLDLIPWLSQQEVYPKVFWKDRDQSTTYAALGNILEFDHVPCLSTVSKNLRFYGGMHFDQINKEEIEWDSFPLLGFWLPQFEIVQTKEKTTLLIHRLNLPCNKELLQLLSFTKTDFSIDTISYFKVLESPWNEQWKESVEAILKKIENKEVEKVVLARKTHLKCAKDPSVWGLLKELQQKTIRATVFAFQMDSDTSFLGATPEKLFSRMDQTLQVDAVAGTRLRGKTLDEDKNIEEELLNNPKDLREFLIVKDFLSSTLLPHANTMTWETEDRVLKNTHVQHLYNRLHVNLTKEIKDHDLIQILHPTPALAGFPKEKSLNFIREHESFDRGWYGAPIGYISPRESSFSVAIRSALIKKENIFLFSGAGIVKGSEADFEWEELNQKIQPFLSSIHLKEQIEEVCYG